jgi:hypothetical protein
MLYEGARVIGGAGYGIIIIIITIIIITTIRLACFG